MYIRGCNREQLAACDLRPKTAVISMYDKKNGPPKVLDEQNCCDHLSLCCHDITEPMGDTPMPNRRIGEEVVAFFKNHQNNGTHGGIVCACERGVGLAGAMVAALIRLDGGNPSQVIRSGIPNRLLFNSIVQAAGLKPLYEPLVSIMTMANYPYDYMAAFLLSLRRQRYKNWECVIVSKGPRKDIADLVSWFNREELDTLFITQPRVRYLETNEHTGHWGQSYRQLGINECKGEVIGLQNDDNYLTPGFIEQMMFCIEDGAQLVLCNIVHNYMGYVEQQTKPVRRYCDLGNWLARTELVRQVPWPGSHLEADGEMVERMALLAGPERVACVRKPLFVHN